jgi:DNA-binding CsgD family transcriptional regulator
VVDRCLHASRTGETSRLRLAIQQAGSAGNNPTQEVGDPIWISRQKSERPLQVVVAPSPAKEAFGAPRQSACIMFVSDPDVMPETDEQLLQGLYGLTPAESHIAALLVQGMDVGTISEKTNVTLNTTRTHVKRVLQKTGAKRQAELVTLVLSGLAAIRLR